MIIFIKISIGNIYCMYGFFLIKYKSGAVFIHMDIGVKWERFLTHGPIRAWFSNTERGLMTLMTPL